MHADFLHNPLGTGNYCHAPSLLKTCSGDLLATWYAYPEDENVDGKLVLARKPAGQTTWAGSHQVLKDLKRSSGNPVLFQDANNTLWLLFVVLKGNYWNDAEMQGCWSVDDGRSWSRPAVMWPERGMMVRHPAVVLENGSLLLPAYDEIRGESVLLVAESPDIKDNGQPEPLTWRQQYRFTDLPIIQPALISEGKGKLTLYFRPATDPRYIWRSRSNNGGRDWSTPVRTPLPNPLSGISAFNADGKTVVINNHTENHQRYPLSVSFSSDGGISWQAPWHIDNIKEEVSYPSFLLDDTGCVHGVYSYNRRMIKYISFPVDEIFAGLHE